LVFGIPGVEGNGLKVDPAVKVHGGNDVLEGGNDTINSSDVLSRVRGTGVDGICVMGGSSSRVWNVSDRGSRG
jgi:hypothetical protein